MFFLWRIFLNPCRNGRWWLVKQAVFKWFRFGSLSQNLLHEAISVEQSKETWELWIKFFRTWNFLLMHRNLNPFSMPSCPQININWKRFFFFYLVVREICLKIKNSMKFFMGTYENFYLKFVKIWRPKNRFLFLTCENNALILKWVWLEWWGFWKIRM